VKRIELGIRASMAWFAEHHFHAHRGHMPNPLLLALHLAAAHGHVSLERRQELARNLRDLPDLLVVEDRALVHDRALDDGEVGLADGIRVRRHRARRDLLAEPDAGVDDDRPAVAAHRVDGDHDPRRVGRHELLHQHSHARRRGDPVLRSVRDGAFG